MTQWKRRIWLFRQLRNLTRRKLIGFAKRWQKPRLRESVRLGQMANEETGFGKAEDKREKNRFAAEDVWNYFRNSENRRCRSVKLKILSKSLRRAALSRQSFLRPIRLRRRFSKSLSPSNLAIRLCFRRIRQPRDVLRKQRG